MNWTQTFAKLLDPYELKARWLPGLLVLFPAITFFTLLYGPKDPLLVALTSLFATCGGPYLLTSFIRTRGQRAQENLLKKWGAPPSALVLRHKNTHLPEQTKLRYHSLIRSKLGISLPSIHEERLDLAQADQCYTAAADVLRPLTKDNKKFPLIFAELVAYGYNRNAFGSRWVGLTVAVGSMIATLLHAGILQSKLSLDALLGLKASHSLVTLVSVVFIFLWLGHFTSKTVQQAGFTYADRLWEALEKIPKRAGSSGRSEKTSAVSEP